MGVGANVSNKAHAYSEATPEIEDSEPQAEELNLLDILIVLARRRGFIFLSTLGAAILTAIVVLILPSEYTAETVILPPAQNSSISSALLGQLGGGSPLAAMAGASLGIKSPGDMYVSLFRSRTVEQSVIEHFGLMDRYRQKNMIDARRAFEKYSTVVLGTKDGLMRISVTDTDPKFAANLANGYVDAFRALSQTLAITEASQRRAFFQEQLKEANDNLTNAEEAMKQTQQSTGLLQVDGQARTLIESAAALRGQIAAKEVELQAMHSYATEGNPQYVMVQQELEGLKAQLAKLSGTDANSASDIIIPKGNIPQAGMEYLRKLRDVKYYGVIEELIAKQFELAKLDEAKQGAIVQVVDPAIPPDKRSFPHRTFSVLLIAVMAFGFSSLWVFIRSAWKNMLLKSEKKRKIEILHSLLSFKGE